MLARKEARPTSKDRVMPKLPLPVRVTAAAKSTTQLTLTFDQAVTLRGVPAYTTNLPGVTALSAEATGLNTIEVTFSASIATATSVIIPYADPAVQNKSGGFVADSTFPLA